MKAATFLQSAIQHCKLQFKAETVICLCTGFCVADLRCFASWQNLAGPAADSSVPLEHLLHRQPRHVSVCTCICAVTPPFAKSSSLFSCLQRVGQRAVILSGMNAAEVGEIIGAYRDAGKPLVLPAKLS